MEHNELVGHELQVLYQSLHQPVLSDNQVAFIQYMFSSYTGILDTIC